MIGVVILCGCIGCCSNLGALVKDGFVGGAKPLG